MKSRKQIIIRASGHAKVCFGRDEDEHNECIIMRSKMRSLELKIGQLETVNKQQQVLLDKFFLSDGWNREPLTEP